MKKEVRLSKKNLPHAEVKNNTPSPDNLKRREAIKRIAFFTLGGFTGTFLTNSCKPPDYSDYSDYSDYYYNYYSKYSKYTNYYDYYSRYVLYSDYKK
jgi:hypothetical protein